MCVFLSLRMDKAHLKKRFNVSYVEEEFFGHKYVQSAFEFANWPVITSDQSDRIVHMNWGLIPHWTKNEEAANRIRSNTVNARIETLAEKPSFRRAVDRGRCLILAQGFFEFRELNKVKYPYYIQLRGGEPFAIAGIFDHWTNPISGEMIRSFSLVTTESNALMSRIHNRKQRMPVILSELRESEWLNSLIDPAQFAEPFPEEEMEAWPVSRLITSKIHANNVPAVMERQVYPELQLADGLNL